LLVFYFQFPISSFCNPSFDISEHQTQAPK
jgi:hypothetical protein